MRKFRDMLIDKDDGGLSSLSYILIYLVLTHVFFWKLLVPGQMVFGTDIQNQSYPIQHMAVGEMIKNRSIMLWNPYIFAGMPFLASFSFPFFYPATVLFFILPLSFAMGYQFVMHFFLMGVFMFVFLRHLKLRREAAFVGGLLFMFSPHLVTLVYPGHGGKIFTMTYLPLALLFLDRALAGRTFFNSVLLGLMVALMFFGGHIQILFYCGITLLLFLIMRIVTGLRERGIKWAVKGAAGFCLAFALGTLLYAVILFPAWEYRGYTHRAGGVTGASSYEFATSFSMPPEDMLYVFMRDPFGWGKNYGPTVPTTHGIFYRGRMGLKLSVDYFGVIGIVLALIGAVFRRSRYTWYFVALGLVVGFLALGGFNPFYPFVYKHIPGFSMFRIPYAIMILSPLCGSVLAASGMQYLLEAKAAREKKGLFYFIAAGTCALAVTLVVAVYWRANAEGVQRWFLGFEWVRQMLWEMYDDLPQRFFYFLQNVFVSTVFLAVSLILLFAYRKGVLKVKYLTLAVSALILVELWPVGWDFIRTVPTSSLDETFYRETPQIKALEADKEGPFRVFSMVTNNELLYRGIQSITGYHAVPLSSIERVQSNMDFLGPALDMLNAKYLLLPNEPEYDFRNVPDGPARQALTSKYELLDDYGGIYLYRNRNVLPRAFLVNNLWRTDDLEQALMVITDQRFKPRETAVLAEDIKGSISIRPGADLSGQKVEFVSYTPDRVEMKVASPDDSFMVVSEVWYPGWKAYVDGKETRVYRADYLIRGLVMPKGEHSVVMEFKPAIFKLGAGVSMATLMFFAGVIGWPLYKGRRGGPPLPPPPQKESPEPGKSPGPERPKRKPKRR